MLYCVSLSVKSPAHKHAHARASLVTLHNSLIVSFFDTSAHLAPPTPPPEAPKPPTRKRKRTLPYQGPDDDTATLRSSRLKQWTIGMGRKEREKFRHLGSAALTSERRPLRDRDEIAAERGVVLLPERGGEYMAVSLSGRCVERADSMR